MRIQTKRALRREIAQKDAMLAQYADVADCIPVLAEDRERLIREHASLSKRVALLEKAVKSYARQKLELGAELSELRAENIRFRAENEYLNKIVDAAAENKDFLRTVYESGAAV